MNQKSKTQSQYTLIILLILGTIFISIFIAGSFCDIKISETLYLSNKNLNSLFGGIVSNLGQAIGFFALITVSMSFAFSSFVYRNKQLWKTITATTLVSVGLCAFVAIHIATNSDWNSICNSKTLGIVTNAWLMVVSLVGGFLLNWFYLNKFDKEKVFVLSFWIIIFCLSLQLVRTCLCVIWSRPRPVLVLDSTKQVEFKPWWLPDPFATFNKELPYSSLRKSFPSGHVTAASVIIASIIGLNKIKPKKQIINVLFLIIVCLITLITAYCRIQTGMHFATDVAFSGIMSCGCFIGFSYLINKK